MKKYLSSSSVVLTLSLEASLTSSDKGGCVHVCVPLCVCSPSISLSFAVVCSKIKLGVKW